MEEKASFLETAARGCRILSIGRQHWRVKKYSYKALPRPDAGVMYVKSGGVDFVTETKRVTARAGDLVFLPEGCRYEALFAGETEDLLINFHLTEMPTETYPTVILADTPSTCVSLLEETVMYVERETVPLRALGALYLFFAAIADAVEEKDAPYSVVVVRACEYLRAKELSVSEIARRCAVSESGLRRAFRKETGMSMLAYRRAFRIKEAMRLLESTDLSLAEIAETLHFFDAAYFSKIFHATIGVTPGEYAKKRKMHP